MRHKNKHMSETKLKPESVRLQRRDGKMARNERTLKHCALILCDDPFTLLTSLLLFFCSFSLSFCNVPDFHSRVFADRRVSWSQVFMRHGAAYICVCNASIYYYILLYYVNGLLRGAYEMFQIKSGDAVPRELWHWLIECAHRALITHCHRLQVPLSAVLSSMLLQ